MRKVSSGGLIGINRRGKISLSFDCISFVEGAGALWWCSGSFVFGGGPARGGGPGGLTLAPVGIKMLVGLRVRQK